VIGTGSILVALVGAVFTGMVSLRHARKDVATANVMELRSHRNAWEWSVRTFYKILPLLDPVLAAEIRTEMARHQERIDNPQPDHKKESAS
jgi:hypothetical protein